MFAIARMSMSPEPSLLLEEDGVPRAGDGAGNGEDGFARASRFESEKRTEFSWRWPVKPPAEAPPVAGIASNPAKPAPAEAAPEEEDGALAAGARVGAANKSLAAGPFDTGAAAAANRSAEGAFTVVD
jgi:hypothetical protein